MVSFTLFKAFEWSLLVEEKYTTSDYSFVTYGEFILRQGFV
jgi:hypothetical protein